MDQANGPNPALPKGDVTARDCKSRPRKNMSYWIEVREFKSLRPQNLVQKIFSIILKKFSSKNIKSVDEGDMSPIIIVGIKS